MAKLFHWDPASDPNGNVHHIARHDVTPVEAEYVVRNPRNNTTSSQSSKHLMTFGATRTGKYLAVVWGAVGIDPLVITVITAYPVERPPSKPRPKGVRR